MMMMHLWRVPSAEGFRKAVCFVLQIATHCAFRRQLPQSGDIVETRRRGVMSQMFCNSVHV